MHDRESALNKWLKTIYYKTPYTLEPLTGDASFRRYFRLQLADTTQIIMDAPPSKEGLLPFVHIGTSLADFGITTPTVYAVDYDLGFALLDDFGDALLFNSLSHDNANNLYGAAMTTLVRMQLCQPTTYHLPHFDGAFMQTELALFKDWFLESYLELSLDPHEISQLEASFHWLIHAIEQQPQTFVHRDYHSRNLMVLSSNSMNNVQLGVIDFQDAMIGPVTYDLVSLLKDCYIQWPQDKIEQWLMQFYEQSCVKESYSFIEFSRAFHLCGIQRHLKVLGIFCRLHLRDKKSAYLRDLPLTFHYVMAALECFNELKPLQDFMLQRVQSTFLSKIQ